MPTLFETLRDNPADRAALAALAQAIEASDRNDSAGIQRALSPYGPGTAVQFSWGPGGLQTYWAWMTPDSCVILFHGLQDTAGFVGAYLGSGQVPTIAWPGAIMAFTAQALAGGIGVIDQQIINAAQQAGVPQVNVLLAGHSHGGAMVQGYLSQHAGPLPIEAGPVIAFTFGAPRALNPQAAAGFPVPLTRIANAEDIIPTVPPYDWYSGFPFTLLTPLAFLFYSHSGNGLQLDSQGNLEWLPADSSANDNTALATISKGLDFFNDSSGHSLDVYARRLREQSNPPVGIPGFGATFFSFGKGNNMATYKIIYFFSQGPWGWSETHHVQASLVDDAIAAAKNIGVLNLRMGIIGSKATIATYFTLLTNIRASNVEKPRDAKLYSATPALIGQYAGEYSDIPNTCLDLQFKGSDFSGNEYEKTTFLRGIPDGMVDKGGQYTPSGAFPNVLNNWVNALIGSHFGMWVNDKSVAAIPIASLAQVGADISVTTMTPHGMVTGDKARVSKVKPAFSEQTIFRVFNASGTTFTLPNLTLKTPIRELGHVIPQRKHFVEYNSAEVVRANHRIAGVPFFRPRGRKRAEAEA